VLGYKTDSPHISPEQKKRDGRFSVGFAIAMMIAVVLYVLDRNYLHVGYLQPVAFTLFGLAIVANLVKGNIDWRKKKARIASGEIKVDTPSEDIQAQAEKVASMKTPKRSRATTTDYSALDSPIEDSSPSTVSVIKRDIKEDADLSIIIGTSTADDMASIFARDVHKDEN
jgi:hypothetical protein